MNNKIIVGLGAILAVSGAVSASSYHRDVVGPGVLYATALASAGTNYCDDTLGSIFPALLCGTGGFGGATIPLDGSAGEADLNPATMVSGTCTVTLSSAVVPATNGDFRFVCGVDRDDTGGLTNVDSSSSDPDGFDDDFAAVNVSGPNGSGTANVCFRADLDGAFDTAQVHVAAYAPGSSVAVGTFSVDLDLSPDATCTPSGHGGGGNTPSLGVPSIPSLIPSWLCFW